MVTCECYIAMLEIEGHLQALNIEEKRVTVEPTEDLEEISLDDDTLGESLESAHKPTLQSAKSFPSS